MWDADLIRWETDGDKYEYVFSHGGVISAANTAAERGGVACDGVACDGVACVTVATAAAVATEAVRGVPLAEGAADLLTNEKEGGGATLHRRGEAFI